MSVNSENRPILVTGGTTGIGRAAVELLATRGHQVYATVRKDSDFEELNKIENVEAVKLDVLDNVQIEKLVEFVKNKGKGLFAVVNNSGVTDMIAINEMEDDDFDYIMRVNLYGPFKVTKALHEFIIESKGRIINIGSIAGTVSPMLMGAYSISKHGIEAYSDTLTAEMEKFGVSVSTIEPGNYQSNIAISAGKRIFSKIEGRRNTKYREELMERISDPNAKPDRSHYKGPGEVADAIYDALLSEKPKPRYMVVPDLEEGTETIRQKVKELVELNEWHDYSFTREQLIAMLDEFM